MPDSEPSAVDTELRHWPPGTDSRPSVPLFFQAYHDAPSIYPMDEPLGAMVNQIPGFGSVAGGAGVEESSAVSEARASLVEQLWSVVNRSPGRTLAALVTFYLAIACAQAATKLLWCDELITLAIARQGSLGAIWRALAAGADPNPPLSHWLTLLSIRSFGQSARRCVCRRSCACCWRSAACGRSCAVGSVPDSRRWAYSPLWLRAASTTPTTPAPMRRLWASPWPASCFGWPPRSGVARHDSRHWQE